MKRFIIAMLLVLCMAFGAYGAESVTLSDAGGRIYDNQGNWIQYIITVTITTAADGSLTAKTINAADTGIIRGGPVGWCLDEVYVDPGATQPDADSTLTITQLGADLLGGNGSELIHNANTTTTHPACDGQPKRREVFTDLSLDVTGNTANSATMTIYLIFVRPN